MRFNKLKKKLTGSSESDEMPSDLAFDVMRKDIAEEPVEEETAEEIEKRRKQRQLLDAMTGK